MIREILDNNNDIDINKMIYNSNDETESDIDYIDINIPSIKKKKKIHPINNEYEIPNQLAIVKFDNDEDLEKQKKKRKRIKLKKIKSIKKISFNNNNNEECSKDDINDDIDYIYDNNLTSSFFCIPIENLDKYNNNENMIKFENENDNEIVYIKENGNEIYDKRNKEKYNDIEIEIEKEIENDTENGLENLTWKEIKENNYIPKNIKFNKKNIEQIPNDISKPIEYFNLIFSDVIMNKIVDSINQCWRQLKKKKKIKKKLITIDLTTFKCFIGVYLTMGLVRKNTIDEYWNNQSNIYSTPGISELFDKDLFNEIYNKIGLFEEFFNLNQFDDDSFLNLFNENCQKFYSPCQDLTIDKSIITHNYQTFQKKYKLFLLKESKSKYVLNCLLNVGKNTNNYYSHYHLINYLTKSYQNQGYILYLDKYFSSLELLSMLPTIGINYVGLINENKIKFSQKEKNIITNNNENIIYLQSNNDILLTIYKSNKKFFIASNCLTNKNINKTIMNIRIDNNSFNFQNVKKYSKIKKFPYSYLQYRKNKK